MNVIRVSVAAMLVLSVSCASNKPVDTNSELRIVQPKAKKEHNVISRDELQAPEITSRDALTAIRHLRPHFFTYRGPNSFFGTTTGNTQISYDFGPLQPVATLTSLNTFGLYEVRFLNAEEAQLRFGLNANGGPVIVLLTNKE